MPINLKPPVKQSFLPSNNPIQAWQNPLQDFLLPFQQAKTELEGKLSQMTSWNPTPSPEINGTNWGQFQGTDPNGANYQPQSLIDYHKTGKTSSELYGGWPSATPPVIPKRDQYGQTLPEPGTLASFDPKSLISGIQDTGKSIIDTTGEAGNMIQNKASGLQQAKQEWRFLTQDQLTARINDTIAHMPDATDEEIAQAVGQLKNEWFFFEGMNDQNIKNPVTDFLGKTPLGAWADILWGAIKMGGQFVGGILEGGAKMSEGWVDMAEWNTNLWASKILAGGTEYWMGMLGWAFPLVSSMINTKAVEPVIDNTLKPLSEGIQDNVVNKGLDLTGMDPKSEEYQNYSNALTTVATVLTTMGILKTWKIAFRETFGENITYDNAKVWDFVKSTWKTAEDLQNAINKNRPNAKVKITDDTPISKVFTPEEYSQMQAMARNEWASGVGRREGIISDATQAKAWDYVSEKWTQITKWMKDMLKRNPQTKATPPNMEDWQNAVSSENVPGTIQKPGIIDNVQDAVFGSRDDLTLAGRAVSPRSVKSKWPDQKVEGNNTAYEWLQQLHDDSIAWRIDSDIWEMKGGAEGIEAGLDYWGKKVGEMTNWSAKVQVGDIVSKLETHMKDPLSSLSWPVKSIANSIIEVLRNEKYADGMSISDIQQAMSDIKSQIFSDYKLVQALKKETAGRWVGDFINTISDRFNKAIDETSGNSIELQRAKLAYSRYKRIQDDFMQSLLVNARNSKIGATGKAGIIIGLYELGKWWATSIPKVLALKYITGKMGEYGTRSWAYEKLIRNFDRKAWQRAKGIYNSGKTKNSWDRSIFTPKPSKNGNNRWNTRTNNSGIPPEGTVPRWVEVPGSKKTKKEYPFWVNVKVGYEKAPEEAWPTKLLPSGERFIESKNKSLLQELSTAQSSAKTGGTWESRIIPRILDKINSGEITRQQAIDVLEKIVDSKDLSFSYTRKPKIQEFIDELYNAKFDTMTGYDAKTGELSKPAPKAEPKKATQEDLYNEIQEKANDGRYSSETVSKLTDEFEKQTGRKASEVISSDFDPDGNLSLPKPKSTRVLLPIKEKKAVAKEVETQDTRTQSKVKLLTEAQKAEISKPVPEKPEAKIIWLTENWGIKNVEPGKQVKYNQGDYYEPVRMALTQKDADMARVGALSNKQMKSNLTDWEKREIEGIKRRYGMTRAEIEKRAQELRGIAKNWRSKTESVLIDLRHVLENTRKRDPLLPQKKSKLSYKGFEEEVNFNKALSLDESRVEMEMFQDVSKNMDAYMRKLDNEKWNIVSADDAKELSKHFSESIEWASKYSRASHKVSSAFAKIRYKYLLDKNKGKDVFFMAWWSWAWKTTAVRAAWDMTKDYGVVYDSNLNSYQWAVSKIEQALESWANVDIAYVYRDIIDAFKNWVLPRWENKWRIVPVDAHINTHIWSYKTVMKLIEKYETDNRVNIVLRDNSKWSGNSIKINKDDLQSIVDYPENVDTILQNTIETEYKKGRISKRIYEAYQ